jgi:hypothetical protein
MTITVTIVTRYEVDLPELDDSTRKYINENYEAASLPYEYQDAEYLDGSITYEEVEH